jgi:cytochrome c551/c552
MKYFFTTIIILFLFLFGGKADPVQQGQQLFSSRCASCHSITQKIVGPALAGVQERHDIEWIIRFVKSSQTVIKDGDKIANSLFEQFNKVVMPDHADLTEADINNILTYIKAETIVKPVAKSQIKTREWSLQSISKLYRDNIFISLISLLTVCFLFITTWLVRFTWLQKKYS